MVDLPGNIIDLQDEDEHVHLLVYADSGVGKTVFGGSDEDVLFIATEDNGTLSAKRHGSSAKKWKVRNGARGWDDVVSAYDWLFKNFVANNEPIPFNWLVLDSLTEMQDMAMQKVLAEAVKMNPSRDRDTPQLQDWQPYFTRFRRLVKAYNSLPVNILYTALQQYEDDEDGEKVALPLLQGKGTQIAKETASWMTSFGQMRVRRRTVGEGEDKKIEEYRQIQWSSTKTIMAKDRTRCLEPRTINLSLKEIRELLEAGPQQPAPGRTPPQKKVGDGKLKVRNVVADPGGPHKTGVELEGAEDDDVDEEQVNLMGV